MRFDKYEGLGNDFLVVECDDEAEITPARAAELCDRRRGVGGDGVLLILPPQGPDAMTRMRVINADGSIPEMCGNGIRCVAIHAARRMGLRGTASMAIETDAGLRVCLVQDATGQAMVTVSMGLAKVLGDRAIQIDGQLESFTEADVGNPHAVLLGMFSSADVSRLGPRLATHPSFPRGTNVEFARVSGDRVDLVVWERGVGVTLACGTGACAAAAVACEKGLAKRETPIQVHLPGGALEVIVRESGQVTMRGPARHVYRGEV
jgi:diaminopimelate epimerase